MAPTTPESEFSDQLAKLARGESREIEHLLQSFDLPVELPETQTRVRVHFLASDASSKPAVSLLADAMAAAALDFCIPRARILEAVKEIQTTGSTARISRLHTQAASLFVKAEDSGEGGELLLFLLMERVLKLPQLLSKMSLKTSSSMHVHGSDGVHARLADDGVLDIYWGESKLYASSSSAFSACFESIAPFLGPTGDEARKQDLLLVRDQLNVSDQDLAEYLLQYFDPSSEKALQVRWNGVCLIGFNHANYPQMDGLNELDREALAKIVAGWRKSVGTRVSGKNLASAHIDVFCIPFPDVSALRSAVREKLGLPK